MGYTQLTVGGLLAAQGMAENDVEKMKQSMVVNQEAREILQQFGDAKPVTDIDDMIATTKDLLKNEATIRSMASKKSGPKPTKQA
jgi:hypothetical protein